MLMTVDKILPWTVFSLNMSTNGASTTTLETVWELLTARRELAAPSEEDGAVTPSYADAKGW